MRIDRSGPSQGISPPLPFAPGTATPNAACLRRFHSYGGTSKQPSSKRADILNLYHKLCVPYRCHVSLKPLIESEIAKLQGATHKRHAARAMSPLEADLAEDYIWLTQTDKARAIANKLAKNQWDKVSAERVKQLLKMADEEDRTHHYSSQL